MRGKPLRIGKARLYRVGYFIRLDNGKTHDFTEYAMAISKAAAIQRVRVERERLGWEADGYFATPVEVLR